MPLSRALSRGARRLNRAAQHTDAVEDKFAILELKYGNVYGGYPNFFAISEIALLVYEPDTKRIFIESWTNNADIDYVAVDTKVNELGHTLERYKTVVNMRTRRRKDFEEEFKMTDEELQESFRKLRMTRNNVKRFLTNNFRKYRVQKVYTFDGRRDIFLCERAGINFERVHILDLQKEINAETNYLFSLKKLAVVTRFDFDGNYLRSVNEEFWLHPIAARQIMPRSAALDAAKLLMCQREYVRHHDDFLIRAAQVLQQIENETAGA